MGNHTSVTQNLCEELALAYGCTLSEASMIGVAAGTHDIGKGLVPESILNKPGHLTPEEFDIIRLHTVYGYNLLRSAGGDGGELKRQIALFHHERFDGHGYWGLTREMQPTHIRIVAIVDVYSALIEKRCYKERWSVAEALGYIEENAGSHFDPVLVGLFVPLVRSTRLGSRS